MRVHELAKTLDITSKEIIEFLRGQDVAVASHASSLTEDQEKMVQKKFCAPAPAPAKEVVAEKPVEKPVEKAAAPVAEAKPAEATETAEPPKKKNIVQVFRPQNSRQAGNRPGQGRPGQGRPGQGRPNQNRYGQGGQDSSGLRQGFSYGQPQRPQRPVAKPVQPTETPAAKPVQPVQKPVQPVQNQ